MKVYIQGKGGTDLTQQDFKASGGEGAIYVKGKTVYKVYHDRKKVIPASKIQELSVLTRPNIVVPRDMLLDSKNVPVGYTMDYHADTDALCKLFTKAFRQRNNIQPDQTAHQVKIMRDTVAHVHSHRILIVDLNEMNFLVKTPAFDDVFFIDVDSYQTPSWPATALMESVRDRHTRGFSELTDWFAFAIVTFQMWIGIHPYKGKHPTITTLDERMLRNISVMNKDVSVPAVCYPFDVIPHRQRDWYYAVFERGERCPPPSDTQAVAIPVHVTQQVSGSNLLTIMERLTLESDILAYYAQDGNEVIVCDGHVYVNKREDPNTGRKKIGDIPVAAFTAKMNRPWLAYLNGGRAQLYDCNGQLLNNFTCFASKVMECDGRVYLHSGNRVLEIEFTEVGNVTIVGSRQVGQVLEQSTQMHDGVVFQDLLGTLYASIFPRAGTCHQYRLKELEGFVVVEAKYENHVLMVIGSKKGTYNRFVFRFSPGFSDNSYDCRIVPDVAYIGLNFTVLDNGITVCMTEDEQLEIFSNAKGSSGVKLVDDPAIDAGMKLFHNGTQLLFAKGNKLYSATMGKK